MAYPEDPLNVVVEFWNGTSWVDITSKTFVRDGGISIRRGFPDEGSTPEPSECRLTLDNRDGRFSPRNPSGTYYGKIGRNTPVRVRVGGGLAGPSYLRLVAPADAVTDDKAALDITGDIDVRIDVALDNWAGGPALMAKYETTFSNNRSWVFAVTTSGFLTLAWSTDGTSGTVLSATSTVLAGLIPGGRKALRVTLDVNNGSGGRTATFYTADTIDGSWVQLGDPVTGAGTTSIFASAAALTIGALEDVFGADSGDPFFLAGKVYAAELRNGINGTIVAAPDFRDPDDLPDLAGGGDGHSNSWLWRSLADSTDFAADARVEDPGFRYIGEISEWPTRWDVSGQDVWTSVTAQGILRRLGQGQRPVRSPLASGVLLDTSSGGAPIAYWPMEDGSGAFSFAGFAADDGSGVVRSISGITYSGTRPDAGELGIGPLLGSDRIPVLAATTTLLGTVPAYTFTATAILAVRLIVDVPTTTGWSDNTPIMHVAQSTNGSTVATWEVRYKSGSGGDLQVRALAADGSQLAASGTLDFNIDGQQLYVGLNVRQSGVDALWTLFVRSVDDDGVTVSESGLYDQTFSSLTVNTATQIRIAPSGGLAELAVGHVALGQATNFGGSAADEGAKSGLVSRAGERASERASRLVEELGTFVLRVIGDGDGGDATPMGAQAIPSTFIDAYNETWAADMALAYETRDELGLSWRSRASLYNQPVALTLDYTGPGEIAPDLEPIDDDQRTRNDITVKRKDGSSYRAVDSTSRMGTDDPPDGVGPYEEQVEVNLYDDSQLQDQAHWRLHLGTWDEPRYPRVVVDMAALAAAGKYDLIAQVCALDVGDRIQLTNLPAFTGTPGTVDLMVLGFEEHIGHPTEWTITLNCVPYGPYAVGEYQNTSATGDVHRRDGLWSTTASGLRLPGTSGANASCPDAATIDLTGNLDLRWRGRLASYANGANQQLVGKWLLAGNQRSYRLRVNSAGLLALDWSTDGTSAGVLSSLTDITDDVAGGEAIAFRATLNVNNGSGGWTVTIYKSTDTNLSTASWTQIAQQVTTSGTTSVFSGSAALTVGTNGDGGDPCTGLGYAAQVYSGIAGSDLRRSVDFTAQADGATSFPDASNPAVTWTVNGAASIIGNFVAGMGTLLFVVTTAGPLWTTSPPGGFPILIKVRGVTLTVSNITGSAPQVFTISAANVSGVTIPPGSQVRVARAATYAL